MIKSEIATASFQINQSVQKRFSTSNFLMPLIFKIIESFQDLNNQLFNFEFSDSLCELGGS